MKYKLSLIPDGTNEQESVLEINQYGEPTISIECAAGTLHADIESRRNTAHNSIYIRFTPKGSTESIDVAALKDSNNEEAVQLLVWSDIYSEDPEQIIPFWVSDVKQALAGEEGN